MGGADLRTADLLRVDPDGTVTVVARDLWFPDGTVITDAGVLLVGGTLGNRVSAFDIASVCSLGPRRDWATFGGLPTSRTQAEGIGELSLAPDGCCLDAEGGLWTADALGGRVVRLAEGGRVLDEISPGTGVLACILGGADGRTLSRCCAPDFDEHARSAAREAELRADRVEVPHAGRP